MAARKGQIRAVKPGEKAPSRPKTITQAASKGTHRELLVAMRDRIAKTVESTDCPPRDLASLSRRLMEIAKDIEQLDLADEQEGGTSGSVEDEAFDASAI